MFLDEIGELSPRVQAKLLRVLQDGEVRRVGASSPDRVDVRVIAASNRDLLALARDGTFRLDLYHRIACHLVQLPPVRARREDIPLLARHFLVEMAPSAVVHGFDTGALAALRTHAWPGNVRELRQTVRNAATLAHGRPISASDLRRVLGSEARRLIPLQAYPELPMSLRSLEHEALRRALEASDGNVAAAATLLGVGRATFYRKLARGGVGGEPLRS